MTEELEALEDIILFLNATEPKGLYCKNIETIKSALERKEKLEKLIKEKRISFVNIYYTDNVDEYNGALGTEIELTEEEFIFLKEMLGEQK